MALSNHRVPHWRLLSGRILLEEVLGRLKIMMIGDRLSLSRDSMAMQPHRAMKRYWLTVVFVVDSGDCVPSDFPLTRFPL